MKKTKKQNLLRPEQKRLVDQQVADALIKHRESVKKYQASKRSIAEGVYRAYFTAQARGEKKTLEVIAQEAGLKSSGNVIVYLSRLGLPYLLESDAVSPEEVALFHRAGATDLTARDVQYFAQSKHSLPTIAKYMNEQGAKKKGRGCALRNKGITYNLASQIYQEEDLGAEPEEIIRKLKITHRQLFIAQEKREIVEPEITLSLNVLFPGERIERPYRNMESWKK